MFQNLKKFLFISVVTITLSHNSLHATAPFPVDWKLAAAYIVNTMGNKIPTRVKGLSQIVAGVGTLSTSAGIFLFGAWLNSDSKNCCKHCHAKDSNTLVNALQPIYKTGWQLTKNGFRTVIFGH